MKTIIIALLLSLLHIQAFAATLTAHYRDRPPEMLVNGDSVSGPLIDILNLAAERSGSTIKWESAPFKRSMHGLKNGTVDLLPRVLYRKSREEFVHYLDAIGVQEKNIYFIVPKGKESSIASYNDLYSLTIGAKRGTAYFNQFDKDDQIKKVESVDDTNLAKMFKASRFDAVIVLDKVAMESEMKKADVSEYSYADFVFNQRIENQFGSSKKLYEGEKKSIYEAINTELKKMAASGEVDSIYQKYNIEPPKH